MTATPPPLHVPDLPADVDCLTAALAYAAAGWYVVPVRAGTKHPGSVVGDAWQQHSSRDPQVIAAWFAGTSHGIALHAGRSGAVIVDVDAPSKLPDVLRDAITSTARPYQSTRSDTLGRGHYVFVQPEGRMIGNRLGSLPGGWGEIRGKNGVIIATPSVHEEAADGGRYQWHTTGVVPSLPDQVANLLDDASPATDAASNAEIGAFLQAHTDATRPELLDVWMHLYVNKISEGESRHDRMVSVSTGAMKEARAGFFDAKTASDTLEAVFRKAAVEPPMAGSKQKKHRTDADAESEWQGILAWAVGQASAADLAEVRHRVAEKVPDTAGYVADLEQPALVDLETAHAVFLRWLGADYDLDVLDAVLATAAAEQLGGDPAWLLTVGGSGAAKTETVAPLAAAGAHVTSTISSEGALLSGTSRRERAKTATGGLLRKIGPSGVLVIKDVTSVLSMNRDARGAVLAALREIYDGRWERNLGSDGGQSLSWTGRIVVIGAVTTAWDRAHEVISSMGDRFVLIRLDSNKGRIASGRQAIANTGDEEAMRAELGQAAAGVLAGVDTEADLSLTANEGALILALADIVTLGRTGVEHDYRGDVIDAHAPEMPTRFAKQLTQILRGGVALGVDRAHMLRIVARCAADSMPPLRLAALIDLLEHPDSTTTDVRKRIDKPRATVDRTLQGLHMLGLLTVAEELERENRTVWRYSIASGVDLAALRRLGLSQKCQELDTPPTDSLLHLDTPCSDKSGTAFQPLDFEALIATAPDAPPDRCFVCGFPWDSMGHEANCIQDAS